jgi:dihydropteroate synthase
VIAGKDAASICDTIVEMNLVSQHDHAAYLGIKLAKAELAFASKTSYIQDKAQGLADGEREEPSPSR